MKKLTALTALFFVFLHVYSQVPDTSWTRYINNQNGGDPASTNDLIFNGKPTKDDGYILVGTHEAQFGIRKVDVLNKDGRGIPWITKLDSSGKKSWEHLAATDPANVAAFLSVQQTADEGYVAAGYTGTVTALNGSDSGNFYIAKYKLDGTVDWTKNYGGSGVDKAYSVIELAGSGYLVAGLTSSVDGDVTGNHRAGYADVWLLRLDASGDIVWKKCYGGSGTDSAYAVVQTTDNGFLITGSSTSQNGDVTTNAGGVDAWVFKVDGQGNLLWQKSYGGTGNEAFKSAVSDGSGKYRLAGYSTSQSLYGSSNAGKKDAWVLALTTEGQMIWSKLFGGSQDDEVFCVQPSQSGYFIYSGFTESNNGNVSGHNGGADAWLFEMANEYFLWQKCLGTSNDEISFAGLYVAENNFAIAGVGVPANATTYDGYMVRMGNANKIVAGIFYDKNANGIWDPEEKLFDEQVMMLVRKPSYQKSDIRDNGLISINVDTGTYTVTLANYLPVYQAFPASIVRSFNRYLKTDSLTFAIQPKPANYTFIGSGDWLQPSNWLNGAVPPSILPQGSTIMIDGAAVMDSCLASCGILQVNHGYITIERGASLTIRNKNGFTLESGFILVNGTMINETDFTLSANATLNLNGTWINQKTLENAGFIIMGNRSLFQNDSTAILDNEKATSGRIYAGGDALIRNKKGGTIRLGIATGVNVMNTARIAGNTNMRGNLTNDGEITPGNSPGVLTIDGDYTATSNAIHTFEVTGTSATDYDRLNVTGTVNLNGTLNVSLLNGFTPSASNSDLIIFTGTIQGTFATVNKPTDYQLVYTNNSVVLRVLSTLPVSFVNVEVKKADGGAKLTWHIQNEQNVSHYEVEKSTNGRVFSKAGIVKAASLAAYAFTDNAASKTVFYRVKCVSRDGKVNYSQVVSYVEGQSSVGLTVFPSPTANTIQVQHPTATAKTKIEIVAVDGRAMRTVFPASGEELTTVDVSLLPAGTYFVRLYLGNDAVQSVKFLKK